MTPDTARQLGCVICYCELLHLHLQLPPVITSHHNQYLPASPSSLTPAQAALTKYGAVHNRLELQQCECLVSSIPAHADIQITTVLCPAGDITAAAVCGLLQEGRNNSSDTFTPHYFLLCEGREAEAGDRGKQHYLVSQTRVSTHTKQICTKPSPTMSIDKSLYFFAFLHTHMKYTFMSLMTIS